MVFQKTIFAFHFMTWKICHISDNIQLLDYHTEKIANKFKVVFEKELQWDCRILIANFGIEILAWAMTI